MSVLTKIQSELKAPKGQYNSFGKYYYRSCEDILEALKPLLLEYKATLSINDEIKEIGNILFVESKCSFTSDDEYVVVTAQAGIDPNRKGMDIAQCFGSSSSYSRKYALNGLFLIDDTKDADATNDHGKSASAPKPASKPTKPNSKKRKMETLTLINKSKNIKELRDTWTNIFESLRVELTNEDFADIEKAKDIKKEALSAAE